MTRNVRLPCPHCGEEKPYNKTNLSRTYDDDGVGYREYCHRCKYAGSHRGETRSGEIVMPARKPESTQRITLSREWADIWESASSIPIANTPAGDYLRARGIDPEYHHLRDALRCSEQSSPSVFDGETVPTMLGLITNIQTGARQSLHRTFIRKTADGYLKERRNLPNHAKAGGVIRLFPDTPALRESGRLAIAEGIETALSLFQVSDVPCWAAIDAGNVENFPVLPWVREIWIGEDAEPKGQAAAERVFRRYRRAGRQAHILSPPGVNDWNDYLQEVAV